MEIAQFLLLSFFQHGVMPDIETRHSPCLHQFKSEFSVNINVDCIMRLQIAALSTPSDVIQYRIQYRFRNAMILT